MSNILSLNNFDSALENKGWTLRKLADEYNEKYPTSDAHDVYNTLRGYRKANANPTLNILTRVADLLECDIDYLLGRFDESTHDIKFIHDETGLSEKAIRVLEKLNEKNSVNGNIDALSLLIEDINFEYLLSLICGYANIDKNESEICIDVGTSRTEIEQTSITKFSIQDALNGILERIRSSYRTRFTSLDDRQDKAFQDALLRIAAKYLEDGKLTRYTYNRWCKEIKHGNFDYSPDFKK